MQAAPFGRSETDRASRGVRRSTNAVGTTEAALVVYSIAEGFLSSVPTDHVTVAWPPARAALLPRLRVWRPRLGLRGAGADEQDASLELGFRFAAEFPCCKDSSTEIPDIGRYAVPVKKCIKAA